MIKRGKNRSWAIFQAVLAAIISSGLFDVRSDEPKQDQTKPGLPRILLMGDSIAAGYAPTVVRLLKGKADVAGLPGNGHMTSVALQNFELIVGKKKWDVIHFNWGLNDLEVRRILPPQYEKNLRELISRLKERGEILIWSSTTPVPMGRVNSPRIHQDVPTYNAVAKKVMMEHGIPIIDLYNLALPRLGELQLKEDVHFNEHGYEVLGEAVAKEIEKILEKRGRK